MLKFIYWSLTLTLVIQACYEYRLTWARVPRIVREMSGNFAVSGEWSPCLSFVPRSLPSYIVMQFLGAGWKINVSCYMKNLNFDLDPTPPPSWKNGFRAPVEFGEVFVRWRLLCSVLHFPKSRLRHQFTSLLCQSGRLVRSASALSPTNWYLYNYRLKLRQWLIRLSKLKTYLFHQSFPDIIL